MNTKLLIKARRRVIFYATFLTCQNSRALPGHDARSGASYSGRSVAGRWVRTGRFRSARLVGGRPVECEAGDRTHFSTGRLGGSRPRTSWSAVAAAKFLIAAECGRKGLAMAAIRR